MQNFIILGLSLLVCLESRAQTVSSPEGILEHFDVYAGFLRPFSGDGQLATSSYVPDASLLECASMCLQEPECRSFDFAHEFPIHQEGVCLLRLQGLESGAPLVRHPKLIHFARIRPLADSASDLQHSRDVQTSKITKLDHESMFFHGNLSAAHAEALIYRTSSVLDAHSFALARCGNENTTSDSGTVESDPLNNDGKDKVSTNASNIDKDDLDHANTQKDQPLPPPQPLCFFVWNGSHVITVPLILHDGRYLGLTGKHHTQINKLLSEYVLNLTGTILRNGIASFPSDGNATFPPRRPKQAPQPLQLDPSLVAHAPCDLPSVDLYKPALDGTTPTLSLQHASLLQGYAVHWPAATRWVLDPFPSHSSSATTTTTTPTPAALLTQSSNSPSKALSTSSPVNMDPSSGRAHWSTTTANHQVLASMPLLVQDLKPPTWLPASILGNGLPKTWSPLAVTAGPAGSSRFWTRNVFDTWRIEAVVTGQVLVALYDDKIEHVPGAPRGNSTEDASHWLHHTLPSLQGKWRPRLCMVGAGDAVVVPPRWWVLVAHVQPSITVGDHRCSDGINLAACLVALRREHDAATNSYHQLLSQLLTKAPRNAITHLERPFARGTVAGVTAENNDEGSSIKLQILLQHDLTYRFTADNVTLSAQQYNLINFYVGCTNQIANASIPSIRFEDLTPERYRSHMVRRFPLHIRVGDLDRALRWRTSLWDTAYLSRRVGHVKIVVQTTSTNSFDYAAKDSEPMPFAQFLQDVWETPVEQQTTKKYMNLQTSLYETHLVYTPPLDKLLDDIPVPAALLPDVTVKWANMWVGHTSDEGSTSQLHQDSRDNVYVLIRGRKRITLFSPADSYNLYLQPHVSSIQVSGRVGFAANLGTAGDNFSPIKYPRINTTLHPRALDARPLVVDVFPGDVVYIPSGWWHQVESFGRHLAINYWFDELPEASLVVPYDRQGCNDYFNATALYKEP